MLTLMRTRSGEFEGNLLAKLLLMNPEKDKKFFSTADFLDHVANPA